MALATSSSTASSADYKTESMINIIHDMHPDIINTHILTRLDSTALASTASVSSYLRRLCTDDNLWRNISTATWPSLTDPIADNVISTIPGGYRSVFSDAFPALHHLSFDSNNSPSSLPSELISAVDIYYQGNGKPIFSRVQRTETRNNWFLMSPLWVDMLEPNELVPTPAVRFVKNDEEWMKHLEENLCLSWILIDPMQKRAANLSSRKPVTVRRYWLTRDLEVLFAVAMAGEKKQATEMVQCVVKVTCCGKVGGEMQVREVNMVMEDTEGGHVSGNDGVVILQKAMENGERKKMGEVEVMKKSFEKFLCMTRGKRMNKDKKQKALDGFSMVVAFIACILFCFLAGL